MPPGSSSHSSVMTPSYEHLVFFFRWKVESFKSYRRLLPHGYVGLLPTKTTSFSFHSPRGTPIWYYVAGLDQNLFCAHVNIRVPLAFILSDDFLLPKLLSDGCNHFFNFGPYPLGFHHKLHDIFGCKVLPGCSF